MVDGASGFEWHTLPNGNRLLIIMDDKREPNRCPRHKVKNPGGPQITTETCPSESYTVNGMC